MELLLNAMKLRAPKETAEQIEQILQMMQMFEIYQNYQRFVGTTGNHSPSSSNKNSNADLFSKLMPMMMAGDSSSNNHPKPNSDFMNKLNQILKK